MKFLLMITFHNQLLSILLIFISLSCRHTQPEAKLLTVGAARTGQYLPLIMNKKVALVTNHSALVGDIHLVDTLLTLGIPITKVMAPEHGFRGDKSDGATIADGRDAKTGIPILSIYGKTKKPTQEMLQDVEVVLFDIQDVGVRFFTFISTMHYVMEACAENNIPFIVLDRPNPNGMYIDGPVLDPDFQSFVGMHPIPLVHGLTMGELAKMINGEGWLTNSIKADLTVIQMNQYDHATIYPLPVKPSPNLPNDLAVGLYPSLALFEGTAISIGRGTYEPFLQFGHPSFEGTFNYSFTPVSIEGMSKYPPLEGETCYGKSLMSLKKAPSFTLKYVLEAYEIFENKENFFKPYFNKLLGQSNTMDQIKAGLSEKEIRNSWQDQLDSYKEMRKRYLLYTDVE
ncbi:exo-beta-N-acetylmuramidase NamZ domain-containing protein [Fulvivirga sp. M361]|uniref:exo-beta-N-acetylmuramidase NamZ family protein n=1 Tax=Fulvivirga sp. M361 TaxID=2594266 RepID=UPI00210577EC|nr:DUF1343 domain-containing protein [Fulvivirga sp. M361]